MAHTHEHALLCVHQVPRGRVRSQAAPDGCLAENQPGGGQHDERPVVAGGKMMNMNYSTKLMIA